MVSKYPTRKVEELCKFVNGHGFSENEWASDGLPIIRIQNLNGSNKFNYFNGNPNPSWIVEPGDLLFAWAGVKGVSFGPFIWKGSRGVLNQHIYKIIVHENVDLKWLYAALKMVTERIESNAHGFKTSLVHVHKKDITSQIISTPPLEQQKAIAAILSTWDEAIKKTERLIRSKSELFLGVTQKVIGSQCKHWRHINIADMFTCVSEKKCPNEELLSVTQDQGVIPRSMLEGRVMSPQGSTEAYKLIVPGDFVVSLRSFQGGIEYSKYRGLISPAYTVLRPKVGINAEFYKKFFKTKLFIEKYLSISVIGIRDGKQISIPDLLITKIPLPSLQEQKKIVLLLESYTSELDLLKELLNKYKMQKKALMQKLLKGKWGVNFKEEKQ